MFIQDNKSDTLEPHYLPETASKITAKWCESLRFILRDLIFAIFAHDFAGSNIYDQFVLFCPRSAKKIMQNKDSRKKKKNSPQKKFTLFGHWNDSAVCNAKLRYWNNGLLKLELLWSKQIEKISP